MRHVLMLCLALLAAPPAAAWTFSADPICTVAYRGDGLALSVTYDPMQRLYAIDITRAGGWPAGDIFAIRFEGLQGLTITTTRHSIRGETLRVTDSGFGNVLNGLEFNRAGSAMVGGVAARFPLDGAAEPVERFRACALNISA